MSRGELGKRTLAKIAIELPDLKKVESVLQKLSPNFVPIRFDPESTIPIAVVCLHDALGILYQIRYAVHEYLAHRIWYLEKKQPPNEPAAIFFSRFYHDDVAIRLYSAGEDLADAVRNMLEIDDQSLKLYKFNRGSSLQFVRRFLKKEKPGHPLTDSVLTLVSSVAWRQTMRYRNTCVHEQQPLIHGSGVIYKRRKRWIVEDGTIALTFGGGDSPDFKIEDLMQTTRTAVSLFSDCLLNVTRFYVSLLQTHGFIVDSDGRISVRL